MGRSGIPPRPGVARAPVPGPVKKPVKQIKIAYIEVAVESSSDVWNVRLVEALFHNIKWREYLGKKGLEMPPEDTCEITAHTGGGNRPSSSAHSYLDPTRKAWRFSVLVTAIGKEEVVKACDVEQAAKLLAEKLKNDVHDAYSLRLKELNEEQKKLQKMTSGARGRLEHLLHKEMSMGLFAANLDSINKRGARLESMREELKVSLAGKRARKKALAREIPRLTTVAREKTAADPVTRELEKIIKLQMNNMENLQIAVKGGHGGQGDIRRAEIKLAESRIRLAERREKIGQKQGDGRLGKLNVELAELGTDIVEIEAQLEGTEERLEELARKRTDIRIAGSSLHLRIAEAERNLKELTQRLGKLEAILNRAGEAQVTLGTPQVTTTPIPKGGVLKVGGRGMMLDMFGPPRGRSGARPPDMMMRPPSRGMMMRPDMMMPPPTTPTKARRRR